MTEREKRRAQRIKTMVVNKISLYSGKDSILHIGLSPLESGMVIPN